MVKQILQIHAILPGQKPERHFNIPVRSSTQQSSAEPTPQQSIPQQAVSPQTVDQQSTSQQSVQPTPFQSAHVSTLQNPPQGVGHANNLDGAVNLEPTRSMAKHTFSTDPSNPAVTPHGRGMSQPQNTSDSTQAQLEQELPASKLLNSNPAPEPRRDDKLRRKDSETQEDDEFVDAQS